jgi:hypothetical protein
VFRNASYEYHLTDEQQHAMRDAAKAGSTRLVAVLDQILTPVGRATEGRWIA